jgi:N-acetylglucosaminyldiphosphoundecaprenol N-acetyl-beta-D-mannosaminyltransferase
VEKYFNVLLEFNHKELLKTIEDKIKQKGRGYVCVVDANIISMAQKSTEYRRVLNSSLVNTCDGSSIALMAGWLHKKKFYALNGPEIFEHYIEKPYSHVLLGSTESVVNQIREKVLSKGSTTENIHTMFLPFCSVDQFEYKDIAESINSINPDIIWVCLGAPKQEMFMNKILPFIDHGVLFGIGAAFNFYIGDLTIPAFAIGSLRFIWLNRLLKEPVKLSKRLWQILITYPKMYITERYRIKKQ